MSEIIAISDDFFKRYKRIPEPVAMGYHSGMRGDEKRKTRLANLRLLRQRYTLEQMAESSGTSASYLSQIINEVVQKSGKNPRALTDSYAEKIERGLGLPTGWLDQEHGEDGGGVPEPVVVRPDVVPEEVWRGLPPKARALVEEIVKRSGDGRLRDADLSLLMSTADRLSEGR